MCIFVEVLKRKKFEFAQSIGVKAITVSSKHSIPRNTRNSSGLIFDKRTIIQRENVMLS